MSESDPLAETNSTPRVTTPGETAFQYDVAFSFLQQDEALAVRLAELLTGRLTTFVYSRRQEDIAGTDGEQVFNRVFGTEARVVVVLYRAAWGQTSFTRIEETAIRNRAFTEGYDFTVFIPLDDPPTAPRWLPKPRIWVGLDRWGVESAAAVIEARVQESGGAVRVETTAERADRLRADLEAENARLPALTQEAGVNAANEEAGLLIDAVQRYANELNAGVSLSFDRDKSECLVFAEGTTVTVAWDCRVLNSLGSAALYVVLWGGRIQYRQRAYTSSRPPELTRCEFDFDIDRSLRRGWRNKRDTARLYSSADIADLSISMLLEEIRKRRVGRKPY